MVQVTYSIYVVSPHGYAHSHAFDEVALGLQGGFRTLGYAVPIVTNPRRAKGKTIVLGANLLPSTQQIVIPDDAILFNLEQIDATGGWGNPAYLRLLKQFEVWDYSERNVAALQRHGINAKQCGIGYDPAINRIDSMFPVMQDIDVLFYGSLFGRRVPIMEAIEATGLTVQKLFGVYGVERDRWIARSKLVLNLRAYDTDVFNVVRVSYLLANAKCVVSEATNDPDAAWCYDGIVSGAAAYLPSLCQAYIDDADARQSVANTGFALIQRRPQAAYLERLLTVPSDLLVQ